MQTLFENITAVTMDPGQPVIRNAYVLISGQQIADVSDRAPEGFTGRRINGHGKVLMPGFTNAHTHMPMTMLRGYADDYDLHTWLHDYIFPAEDKMTAEDIKYGSDLAIAEMIASGTSSVTDMYSFCDEIASSIDSAGIKANISRGITSFSNDFNFETNVGVREMKELVDKWHGYDAGRIKIDVSIHAEYTSSPKVWTTLADYAKEKDLGMHVHVSETKEEHERCIETYGCTPTRVLNKYGVFDVPATAAHCVWVDPEDMVVMSNKGVTVAYNPVSNMKLASGIAPVINLLSSGVNVALGTDGVASNNSHDMFEEMKLASLAQKVKYLDPKAGNAFGALNMATVNGAISQRRSSSRGMVKAGMDADLIMLDFDRPHLVPNHNVLSNLVYSARGSDVVMNMVRGRILYSDGTFHTIDIEKVKYEVARRANI